jgi:Zn-dependent peptidase ImmA (M78 family)/DNA-binding XRE family transcriptional regulator
MNQPEVNNKMIELARMSRGYSQKDLAAFLPINQPNLSRVEKGLLDISEETLTSIAKSLGYPIDFFYQEELKTPFSSIYFRKRAKIAQKSLDKIFTDVKLVLKAIDALLQDIEIKEYPRYLFDLTDGWTPESVAIRMREILKIQPGPVKNLVKTIEEQGIIVYFYDTDEDKFDGLTAYTDKGYPIIFINKNMSNDRIVYTLVHEFGHLVNHIPCNVEPWRDVENEANQFAAEFLMPARDCIEDLASLSFNKLTVLKAYWGVSKAAIIRRAKTLGTISESTYKYLMIELGRRNERKVEAGFIELDEPLILKEIVTLLKSELEYTDETLASSTHLFIEDYLKYFGEQKRVVAKIRTMRRAI